MASNLEIADFLDELLSFRQEQYHELCEFNNFTARDDREYLSRNETIRSTIANLRMKETGHDHIQS